MTHPQMFDDDDPLLDQVRAIALALPYLGPSGWIGLDLDERTDRTELAELIEESYRTVAPRRLVVELEEGT